MLTGGSQDFCLLKTWRKSHSWCRKFSTQFNFFFVCARMNQITSKIKFKMSPWPNMHEYTMRKRHIGANACMRCVCVPILRCIANRNWNDQIRTANEENWLHTKIRHMIALMNASGACSKRLTRVPCIKLIDFTGTRVTGMVQFHRLCQR